MSFKSTASARLLCVKVVIIWVVSLDGKFGCFSISCPSSSVIGRLDENRQNHVSFQFFFPVQIIIQS